MPPTPRSLIRLRHAISVVSGPVAARALRPPHRLALSQTEDSGACRHPGLRVSWNLSQAGDAGAGRGRTSHAVDGVCHHPATAGPWAGPHTGYRLAVNAQCPLVLVPPAQSPQERDCSHRPVALLVGGADRCPPATKFALDRASEWEVPLAVFGSTSPVAAELHYPGASSITPELARQRLEKQLGSLHQSYSQVEVSLDWHDESSLTGLVSAALSAQLIVLAGQSNADRAVAVCALQQGRCVAVVPATSQDRKPRTQQPLRGGSVADQGTLAPT